MLKAAFDRETINPILPIEIEGYTEARFQLNQAESAMKSKKNDGMRMAQGIRDDVFMDTVVFEDERPFVLFVLDVMAVDKSVADASKKAVAEACGISVDDISITCTHTHNGPLVTMGMDCNQPLRMEYWEMITEKMIFAVKHCRKHLVPVKAIYDEHVINGCYNNRNHPGEYYFNKSLEITLVDTEHNVPLVKFMNVAVHPTILGIQNMFISNDIFGVARRYVQGYSGIPTTILNGEAGDVSPRLTKRGVDWNEAVRMGEAIGSQILDPNHPVELPLGQLKVAWTRGHVDYNPKESEFLLNKKKELEAEIPTLEPGTRRHKMATTVELYDVNDKLSKDHVEFWTDGLVVDFGGFRFVTVPSEIDTELGRRIRAIDDKPTFLLAYSNGFDYYAVNNEEFGKVFESFVTRYPYGFADEFVNDIIASAKNL